MRKGILRAALLAASGMVAAAAFSTAASATVSIDTSVSGGSAGIASLGSINGAITYVNASNQTKTENAAIGEIALKGHMSTSSDSSLTTIPVFCIDIYDTLGNGTFTQSGIASITSPNSLGTAPNTVTSFSQTQLDNVLRLLVYTTTGSTPLMKDAVTSAATQMALWEILNESSSNSWDVSAGTFKIAQYGGDTSQMVTATADANSWLSQVKSGPINTSGYSLSVWDPGASNQRQVQLLSSQSGSNGSPSGVPEPATWATIVLGFGVLGSALRSGKRVALSA